MIPQNPGQHPGNVGNRRPLPPVPNVNRGANYGADDVEKLRARSQPQDNSDHIPDDDVPAGRVWEPGPEDHVSRAKQKEMVLPDFIPMRLSGDLNPAQREFAAGVVTDQIRAGTRDVSDVPTSLLQQGQHPGPGAAGLGQQRETEQRELPDDFDPEVDDPDDFIASPEALRPADGTQQEALRNSIREAQRQPQQERTGSAPLEVRKGETVDVSDRPGIMQAHPVLAKLRSRYSIAQLDIRFKEIDGINYGFRKYNNQAYLKFVTNRILPTIETEAELSDKHGYAIASIALASIDGIPCWEVFGVELDPTMELPEAKRNPLNPPTSVVISTAEVLYKEFVSGSIPELGDALARAYAELFPDIDLTGNKKLWVYTCTHVGCQERIERLPEHDSDGTQKPYYCTVHGTPMRALGSKEDLGNIPLA